MNEFVENWNAILPNHPIQVDELSKPSPRFYIGAILALLEALDTQTEEIIRLKPNNAYSENSEAFAPILPLFNLTHAVNYFLLGMNSDNGPITMADLIMPTKSSVTCVLRILHNLVVFVQERRQCIGDSEEEVQRCSAKLNQMADDKDKLKTQIDGLYMDIDKTKKRTQHMEKEVVEYGKPNVETEQELNKLKSQFENLQENIKGVDSELQTEEMLQRNLSDEIIKLKSLLLTEGEQMEISAHKELVLKKESELGDKIEELQSTLWRKEADINIFEEIFHVIDNYQVLWTELEQIFNNIKEVQKSNKSTHVKEKELGQLERESSELEKRLEDLTKFRNEMETKCEQIESEIAAEIENNTKEENVCMEEYQFNAKKNSEMVSHIQRFQTKSHEYHAIYENMFNKYTNEIPAHNTSLIEGYVSKIEEMLAGLIG